jgi:hypothetical protein
LPTGRNIVSYDPIHPEGIYQCEGCGKVYPEYINGCLNWHDDMSRRVALVVMEEFDA